MNFKAEQETLLVCSQGGCATSNWFHSSTYKIGPIGPHLVSGDRIRKGPTIADLLFRPLRLTDSPLSDSAWNNIEVS
jgi:hypothetical protein